MTKESAEEIINILTTLESKGIDPSNYTRWLQQFDPGQRDLAKKLTLSIEYLTEKQLKEKMFQRWEQIFALANGKNIFWAPCSRASKKTTNKPWKPSGYLVSTWFCEYLQRKGFTTYQPENDPLFQEHFTDRQSWNTYHSPYVLYYSNLAPTYPIKALAENIYDKPNSEQNAMFLQKGTQRVVIVLENKEINLVAVKAFLLGGKKPTANCEEMGVVAIGDDWTHGYTEKSNAAINIPLLLNNYSCLFTKSDPYLALTFGYATGGANRNLDTVIASLPNQVGGFHARRLPGKNRISILHRGEPTTPVISDLFSLAEIKQLAAMHICRYNDWQGEWGLREISKSVLVHSKLSVPDNMPSLILNGRNQQKPTPLLVHPKKKKITKPL